MLNLGAKQKIIAPDAKIEMQTGHSKIGAKTMKNALRLFFISIVIFAHSFSATIVVRNTNDTGDESLRTALQAANANPGPDVIEFLIPTSDANYDAVNGYWSIHVQSTLPTITDDSLTIDGFSQHVMNPEASPDMPLIVISGFGISQQSHGLLFWGAYNTITSICIGGFRGAQIWIKGQYAHDDSVQGCYIGLYPDGITPMNDPQNPGFPLEFSKGVLISNTAKNNLIGGSQDYMRNVICNMFTEGVLIEESYGNKVQGNYIGVARDGLTPQGNGWIDVPRYNREERKISRYSSLSIQTGSASNIIGGAAAGERNVICAGGRAGIRIEGVGADSNVVRGNYLGLGADGLAHDNLGNAESGLKIQRGAQYNVIGGEEAGAGNVIADNGSSGLQIRENVSHNVIVGNLIGLTADGASAAPNAHNGIYLFGQADSGFPQDNLIGPGNVIIADGEEAADESYAYTWAAVRLDSSGTTRNKVFGNWLSTDKSGALGSDFNSGVIIGGGAHDNVVGPENTIANTKKYGVWIRQKKSIQNSITANSYANNGLQHIFLSDSGNTMIAAPQNMFVDADSVSGFCVPLGKVELYVDDGATFVDSVFADAAGHFVWNGQTNDAVFVATATDTAGNSSEFSSSQNVPVELAAFAAHSTRNGVLLTWRTASESNNLGFYLQRGASDFQDIAFVAGHGSSAEQHDYSCLDETPVNGTANYRLRQVDFDGAVSFSQSVSITLQRASAFSLLPPFPNPFNGETALRLQLAEKAVVDVRVFNVRGEYIAPIFRGDLGAGEHRLTWNGRGYAGAPMPSGLYIIRAAINGKWAWQHKVMFVR